MEREHICESDQIETEQIRDAHGFLHRITHCAICGARMSKPLPIE